MRTLKGEATPNAGQRGRRLRVRLCFPCNTRKRACLAVAAKPRRRESGARRARELKRGSGGGALARAPRDLLYNRREREALDDIPEGHALVQRSDWRGCFPLFESLLEPIPATLGFPAISWRLVGVPG